MKEVFADTFHFLAIANPSDKFHELADDAAKDRSRRLVTTAFVLIEVGNGFAERGNRALFAELLDLL